MVALLEGNGPTKSYLEELTEKAKERERIQKQLRFVDKRKLKSARHKSIAKEGKEDAYDEESIIKEKKLVLSKN